MHYPSSNLDRFKDNLITISDGEEKKRHSRSERDGYGVSRILRCNNAGLLLLDAKERHPCSCSLQEVQDAKVKEI